MGIAQIEIQIIAVLVASSCALSGIFLVLRKMAMMSDAISHSILLGIVVAFFIIKDLSSPLLIVAAAGTGVLTVYLVELVFRTKLLKEDAAIGIIFPLLFSIGVILISRYAGNIHLDTDAILLGELAFAPFNRMEIFGLDIGAKGLYLMVCVFILNSGFIILFFKELKLSTFDLGLAATLGFSPILLHYSLMTIVSITAVASFDTVGAILVVALMIAPPATAYLITNRLWQMIVYSVLCGAVSALGGYWLAHFLDLSIAGSMASIAGFVFLVTLISSPKKGLIARKLQRYRQKWLFKSQMLIVHLLHHEGLPEAERENRIEHLNQHFGWNNNTSRRVVMQCKNKDYLKQINSTLVLTEQGKREAQNCMDF